MFIMLAQFVLCYLAVLFELRYVLLLTAVRKVCGSNCNDGDVWLIMFP
jgi:hypothetical protein